MRFLLLPAALGVAQWAAAAAVEPKPSDVLKPEAAREIASPINDRFALRASFFSAAVATDLRLDDDTGGLGTDFTAEDDFGMRDKDDQGRIELTLRLRERNRIRLDYFKLTRNGANVLARTIEFGDQTFVTNDRVQSLLDWRTINFTYLYSVFHNSRFELGVGLGLHILEGEARARVQARQIREEESGVFPFPTLAADATWRISRRFALTARANFLSADVDDSTGSISDYHADLQYRWQRNFAVGLGYTLLRTEVDVVDDEGGAVDFEVDGPELFFRASF